MSSSRIGRLCRLLAGRTTAAFRENRAAESGSPAEGQDQSRADLDTLTGLLNRAGLIHELRRRSAGGDRLAVLYFDLDQFKVVNECLGYAIGDTLLKAVAKRLRGICTPRDSIARIGGDQFVILSAASTADSARAAAERIVAAIGDEPFFLGKEVALVSGSVGIAFTPDHGTELGPLLGEADAALHDAKLSGRGRCAIARTAMQPRAPSVPTIPDQLLHRDAA